MNRFKKIYESSNEHIKSESFKKWFGKSKVVNDNGDPLVVYHGTSFKVKKGDSLASMIWFTDDSEFAGNFVLGRKYLHSKAKLNYERSRIYPCFLKIENPIEYDKGYEMMYPEELARIIGIPFDDLDKRSKELASTKVKLTDGYKFSPFGAGISLDSPHYKDYYDEKPFSLFFDNLYLIEVLKEYGFDGVITTEEKHKTYQVWNENQIKSIFNKD